MDNQGFWQMMFNITLTRMNELKDELDKATYESKDFRWCLRKNLNDNIAWHKLSHKMLRIR